VANKCPATKRNGQPCKAPPTEADGYCWAHSATTEARRKSPKSRAGKIRAGLERLAEIDKALADIATGVMEGRLDRARSAIAIQALNARVRLASVEVAVKSQTEVAATFEELERRLQEHRDPTDADHGGGYR
jgi:hypothetical protein